jgi:cytochrome c5
MRLYTSRFSQLHQQSRPGAKTAYCKLFLLIFSVGLFFLGACITHNQTDSADISKSTKEPPLGLKLAAGETLYETNCAACYASGSSGAPKPGNKEAWRDRMAEEKAVMAEKAIGGFDGRIGMMPPKGGNSSLTDEEVKTVILCMTSKVGSSEESTSAESPVM